MQADSLRTSCGYLDERAVNCEEFEDIKWVTRIRKQMKDRQNNGQKKKRKKGQTTIY